MKFREHRDKVKKEMGWKWYYYDLVIFFEEIIEKIKSLKDKTND